MIRNFDQLLNLANNNLQQADRFETEHSAALAHLAIGWTLIAIAQELHRMNERADIEKERQELEEARTDRTKAGLEL